MSFDGLAARAMDTAAKQGADYTDVRFEVARAERIEVRNGVVATLSDSTSRGYGIRALVDGAWGFAASSDMSEDGVDRAAARAVEIAQAGASIGLQRIGQAPLSAYTDRFATAMLRDPREVSLGDRVALLLDAEKELHVSGKITVGRSWLDLWTTDKIFYSSIGSRIEQSIRQTGSGIQALAVGDRDVQRRTYPGDVGLYKSGGWEIVEQAALRENAQRIAHEAVALLDAPQCPSGTFDVVLGGSQVSLQMHESCGHPCGTGSRHGVGGKFLGR